MSATLYDFVAQYGLLAIFLGCLAEGESAAMLAGFFAHQGVFVPWQAFAVTFTGAWLGDTIFFLAGRHFADRPIVVRILGRPGLARAHRLLVAHPNLFVLGNRFVYGMRLVGGVAAGLSGLSVARFLALNAVSALVWATLFGSIGYFLGLGAERLIGEQMLAHEGLILATLGGVALAALVWFLTRRLWRRDHPGTR